MVEAWVYKKIMTIWIIIENIPKQTGDVEF